MIDVLAFGEPLVGFYPPHGASLADDIPIKKIWGGDTSNVVLGIARLGGKSMYLTRVGDDPFGKGFINLWNRNGVDTSLISIDPERRTGLYFVSFEGNRHSMTYHRTNSAASAILPEEVDPGLLVQCRFLHLSGISLGMSQAALRTGMYLMDLARKSNCKISFDVNYRPAQWRNPDFACQSITAAIESGIDILEITDDEMSNLGWGDDPLSLQKRFPNIGTIAFRQGAKGSVVLQGRSVVSVPAIPVTVEDTVGAGDSYDSGFLMATIMGMDIQEAAWFGTAAAALTCTGVGPLEKMPYMADVQQLLETYRGQMIKTQ